MYILIVHFSD